MSIPINLSQSGTYTHGVKAILLNRILLVLSFIGLFVAGALSMEKALHIVLPCGNKTGCDLVASDPSSSLFGVLPVAYIGLGGYLLFAGLAIARSMKTPYDTRLVTGGYVAAAIGTAFSLYLQYISFFHIHAVCPYCLTSAITMVLTLISYALLSAEIKKNPLPTSDLAKVDLWMITGLPIVMIVALAVMSGSEKSKGLDVSKIELNEATLVPDQANLYGASDAPVTLVEFADLCCHSCQVTEPVVKEFAEKNPGVRIVFREFPLPMHQYGKTAAAMAEYAAEKGKFWDFTLSVMGLMRQPTSVSELLDIAKSVGLDTEDMKKRLSDTKDPVFDRVTRDLNVGHKLGIDSTPTFVILAKGVTPTSAGPNDVIDKLRSNAYKSILGGSVSHG